jgi:hypothetical protein
MKKTYGVCFGMLAMGLAVLGAPASRAQSRMAAGEAASASTTTEAATPAASSPTDLDKRIEALEMELSELRTELEAKKEAEPVPAVVATPAVAAQDAAKPPDKVTVASLLGPTSVSGFVDAYYNVDFNHPYDHDVFFCAFDCKSQTMNLNMVELILDKAPDATAGELGRTGYHVSLGYGETQAAINSAEVGSSSTAPSSNLSGALAKAPGFDQYVKEAYFSYLAPVGKGLQIDVGKFVTPMGAEVIESKDNWNYSRGLLFTYAIPLNHFGVRAKYTWNDKFNLTGYFVNGFNNIVDNNSGKTYGVSAAMNPTKKNSVTLNYFAGPEEPTGADGYTTPAETTLVNVNNFWRQTWDLVYMYNLTSKLTFMMNYDYVHGDRLAQCAAESESESCYPEVLSSPVYYTGGAGYLKYAFDDKNYVAARYEYFYDRNNFLDIGVRPHAHVQEFTATYQRTISTHLLTRLEYRRDMTGDPEFLLANFGPGVKQQSLITVGMIFLFDSRDAK